MNRRLADALERARKHDDKSEYHRKAANRRKELIRDRTYDEQIRRAKAGNELARQLIQDPHRLDKLVDTVCSEDPIFKQHVADQQFQERLANKAAMQAQMEAVAMQAQMEAVAMQAQMEAVAVAVNNQPAGSYR